MATDARSVAVPAAPPHDAAAEAALCGALILGAGAIDAALAAGVRAHDFYLPAHAAVFEAAVATHAAHLPIDTVTVSSALKTAGKLDAVGGPAGVARLLDAAPASESASAYAKTVRELSMVRALAATCRSIAARCMTEYGDVPALVEMAVRDFYAVVRERLPRSPSMTFGRVAEEVWREIEAASAAGDRVGGLPTGIAALDGLVGGLHRGELTVLAGRPSSGKTALAIQIAARAARQGTRALVFSLEMSRGQIGRRMIADDANVDAGKLRVAPPRDDAATWRAITGSVARMGAWPGLICDDALQGHAGICAEARRVAAQDGGLGLVVVDYVQLMRAPPRAETREQAVAENTRAMKALARELDAPVLLLAQLSRRVEQRGADARPLLSDLRESGSIEADADVVLFLHREAAREFAARNGGAELAMIVAKNRNGPTGTVSAWFDARHVRFAGVESGGES